MTEKNTKKEPSNLEKTLLREDFQKISATNLIKSNPFKYGQAAYDLANASYGNLMNSESVSEIKKGLYDAKAKEYQSSDVAGDPLISNPEVSSAVIKQIEGVMEMSKLGDLYAVVKKVAPGLDIKIDNKIKDMSQKDLMEIIIKKKAVNEKGQLDPRKLTKEELSAFNMYNILSNAYKEANVMNLSNQMNYTEFNEAGKQIDEILNPKPKNVEINPSRQEMAEAA